MRGYRYSEISHTTAVSEGTVHAVQGYGVTMSVILFLMCGRGYMERQEREKHGCSAGS